MFVFFLTKGLGGSVKEEIELNKQSAKKLHKLIIRKFEKPKLCSSFIDSIWQAYLAYMQLLNKFNKRIYFYCVVIDIYSNYVLVIPLKDKRRYHNY